MNIKPIIETTVPKPKQNAEKTGMVTRRTSHKMQTLLLVGPLMGIFFSIIAYAIINFVSAQAGSGDNSIINTIINILLLIVGALSVIALIPCLIIGLYLSNKNLDLYE